MEMVLNMGAFEALDKREMMEVEGGLLGVAWLTGALLLKVIGAGVTIGAGAVGIYYATK